ncbi:MAG TPA: TetR/AcrR family transcriptional regulator [Glycomyces sp.]|nr:TetR/AcrR family transcriptional regulator [Glycomyces sp.]
MSEARNRWLDEGVEMLAEEGFEGVRIDRIAARLGLSKGSFHHHFDGAAGFKHDLLAHLEDRQVGAFADMVAEARAGEGASPRESLLRLVVLLDAPRGRYRPRLETALRAWALTDPDAARVQAGIDEARLRMLEDLWRRISDDEAVVRAAALLPYVIALGASVLMPPLDTEDLQRLYALIPPPPGGADALPRSDA